MTREEFQIRVRNLEFQEMQALEAHDQQQRDELTSWRTTAQSVGAVDPHALSLHLGEQRDEIARLRAALKAWQSRFWQAVSVANGLTNYVDQRPALYRAEEELDELEKQAHAALKEGGGG